MRVPVWNSAEVIEKQEINKTRYRIFSFQRKLNDDDDDDDDDDLRSTFRRGPIVFEYDE